MLKSLHVLLRLSPLWYPYTKGSHKEGVTKRSIITCDEIKDRICKELVSVYNLVFSGDPIA